MSDLFGGCQREKCSHRLLFHRDELVSENQLVHGIVEAAHL